MARPSKRTRSGARPTGVPDQLNTGDLTARDPSGPAHASTPESGAGGLYKALECAHVTLLSLWLGGLVMAGAVAAQVFPTVKGLEPRAPAYENYDGEHWLIVAGHVGDFVFFTTDIIQFLAAFGASVTLIAAVAFGGLPLRRVSTAVRSIALGLAVMGAAFQILYVGTQMNDQLRKYWLAAEAGDNQNAELFRKAFNDLHPQATLGMSVTTIALLVTVVGAVWSIATFTGSGARAGRATPAGPPNELQEPELARPGKGVR